MKLKAAARLTAFAFLAVLSFLVVNVALGTPIEPIGTDKIRDALSLDDSKPRVNGQAGEVKLLDVGKGSDFACKSLYDSHPGYDEAKGSRVSIDPSFIPAGLIEQQGGVTLCEGLAIAAARWWAFPVTGGPVIQVFRYIRPEAWVNASAPADRLTTQTVKGRNMTVLKEVVQDAGQVRGNSGVFWADKLSDGSFLVTAIYGLQITAEDLLQVAGGLVQ